MQINPQDERPDETGPSQQGIEPAPGSAGSDYDDTGVPSFDYVRDRIENRAATAIGWSELPAQSSAAAELDKEMADRDQAGRERLERIRRSMRGE